MSEMPTMDCPWCKEPLTPVLVETGAFYAVFDAYPVNRGHTLIVSKKHVSDLFTLGVDAFASLHGILANVKALLDRDFHPSGYNVGANCGQAAGQTVFHFHLHVIPRYENDVPNPRGGVRNLKAPLIPY